MASIYSWESFIRTHGGEPGARDVFEKVIDDLLRAENPDKEVHIVKASRGDGGIDVYVHQTDGIDIYQCKFFMGTLDTSKWSQIKQSFKKAMEPKGVRVLRWYLCLPREMQKEDIEKWDAYKKEKEKEFSGVELCCIDGNEIISRMEECDRVKNTALIDKYFNENRKKHFTNKDLIIPFTMSKANGAQGGTYVPRDDLLAKVEENFKTDRIVFLSGMGGCGKSELARAYGYKHRDDYEEIFWLTCDDGAAPDFMELMEKADLLSKIEKSDAKDFSDKILIIVDNCNKDEALFLSELENWTGAARILVTTRLSFMGSYESIIPVESDDPEKFAYIVFERNYCKKPRWGREKILQNEEADSVREICRAVQYNTMVVSLIGIRLREYSNLSISDCARKMRSGIGAIKGEIKYAKDQKTRSEDMKEILKFLFSDILNNPFSDDQKAVLTVLSLTSATWYEIDYICSLLGEMSNEYAIRTLLDFGWLQGDGDRMTIHPLIAEVISDQPIVRKESAFYESLLQNYLGLPDKYLRKESLLINKVLKLAEGAMPEVRLATMLLLNHSGYRSLFAEMHPEVKAAYFVYAAHDKIRYIMYRDLGMNETGILVEVPCQEEDGCGARLLMVYNTGKPYTLDLDHLFNEEGIITIPAGLCWNDKNIRKCILPKTLELIGGCAFFGCSGLSGELRFPENLILIGDSAFFGCSGLRGDLHFPETLIDIGDNAFFGCSGLSGNLYFPENLLSIGDSIFSGCSGLSGELCFPENLTQIGDGAFFGCSGLSGNLHFPEILLSIGKFAFSGCSGLSGDIHFSEILTTIGDYAFSGCSGLSGELRLPEFLESVGDFAFEDCSGLSGELRFPESLMSIGNCAFSGCSGLSLPEIVKQYGIHENSNNNLKDDNHRAFVEEIGTYKILRFPDDLSSIGNNAYSDCWLLSGELRLPGSLTEIGDSAFSYCSGLSGELRFPESLTKIGDSAFEYCTGLSGELRLPKSLTEIGDCVFEGCRGFSGELYLSENLISIGSSAFSGCNGLSGELRLPESLISIGSSAFSGCNGLSGELRLPESLISIGSFAFSDCSGLSGELHIPRSLMSIGVCAFSGIDIKKVVFHNPNTEITSAFDLFYSTIIVGYRHSTAEAYAREHGLVFEELEG